MSSIPLLVNSSLNSDFGKTGIHSFLLVFRLDFSGCLKIVRDCFYHISNFLLLFPMFALCFRLLPLCFKLLQIGRVYICGIVNIIWILIINHAIFPPSSYKYSLSSKIIFSS